MANTSDASLWRPKKGGLLQRTGGRCVKQLIGWHRTLQMHLFGPTSSRKLQTGGQCGRCCVERPLRTAAKRTRRRRAPSWPWSKRTMLTRKTCSTFNSRRSLQSIANSKLFLSLTISPFVHSVLPCVAERVFFTVILVNRRSSSGSGYCSGLFRLGLNAHECSFCWSTFQIPVGCGLFLSIKKLLKKLWNALHHSRRLFCRSGTCSQQLDIPQTSKCKLLSLDYQSIEDCER